MSRASFQQPGCQIGAAAGKTRLPGRRGQSQFAPPTAQIWDSPRQSCFALLYSAGRAMIGLATLATFLASNPPRAMAQDKIDLEPAKARFAKIVADELARGVLAPGCARLRAVHVDILQAGRGDRLARLPALVVKGLLLPRRQHPRGAGRGQHGLHPGGTGPGVDQRLGQ